jgi:hypothetical protein
MRESRGSSPIGSIVFGLIFLGAGLFSVFIFSRISELSCTRMEPSSYTCVRNIKLFGLIPLGEEQLPTIRQAYLSESCDEDGCSYRVDMRTDEGDFALADYYEGGIGAYNRLEKKVIQINAFVSDPNEETLLLEAGLSGILLSFLPMLFVLIGAGVCIFGLRRFLVNLDNF